jgi:hypothetical protein
MISLINCLNWDKWDDWEKEGMDNPKLSESPLKRGRHHLQD